MSPKTVIKKDLSLTEQEALKLFLLSVKDEVDDKFSSFSASVDRSARVPQLHIRENGKI